MKTGLTVERVHDPKEECVHREGEWNDEQHHSEYRGGSDVNFDYANAIDN